jgi:peroxiredoxin
MIELGELEAHQADFARRNARVVVASVDDREESVKTQARFPHLIVVSDPGRELATQFQLIHPHAGPGGDDIATPTTFLIDRHGVVQWVFRPDRVLVRLSPGELLAAVDKYLPSER